MAMTATDRDRQLAGLRRCAALRRKVDPARLREWHAAGWTDRRVADETGASIQAVYQTRKALGLPCNRNPIRGDGGATIRRIAESRKRARARLAESYGLPPDISPRAVRILLALAGGPLARRELAAAVGDAEYGRTSYFARLCWKLLARGLIVRMVGRRSTYFLSPEAMDRLTKGRGR